FGCPCNNQGWTCAAEELAQPPQRDNIFNRCDLSLHGNHPGPSTLSAHPIQLGPSAGNEVYIPPAADHIGHLSLEETDTHGRRHNVRDHGSTSPSRTIQLVTLLLHSLFQHRTLCPYEHAIPQLFARCMTTREYEV